MAISALVVRENKPKWTVVDSYYKATHREPTKRGALPVDRVAVFGRTFVGLAQMMLAEKRSHYVVVTEGTPEDGLTLPVAPESDVSAGNAMEWLLKVVDELDETAGKTVSDETRRAAANDWSVPEGRVLSLGKICWAIRNSAGTCVAVHIRGCNIGADVKHLRGIQRLFKSAVVSAPNCGMFYVPVSPDFGTRVPSIDAWVRAHAVQGRRFIYTRPAIGPLVLDIEYLGSVAKQQAATETSADIRKWAAILDENPQSAASTSFPVAGLYPDGMKVYFLANEPGYLERIVEVRE